MSVLERAKAHFQEQPLKRIEVPEWDSTIFSTAVTIEDRESIREMCEKDTSNEYMLCLIIRKAVDHDGQRIFAIGNKSDLKSSVDSNILARISDEILKTGYPKKD